MGKLPQDILLQDRDSHSVEKGRRENVVMGPHKTAALALLLGGSLGAAPRLRLVRDQACTA